jgi:hypothetical protein
MGSNPDERPTHDDEITVLVTGFGVRLSRAALHSSRARSRQLAQLLLRATDGETKRRVS